jgi:diketogulonate reductase-like aldo/keto reductase
MSLMKSLMLPGDVAVPVLGQGTWKVGDDPRHRKDEIAALRLGVELGMTLIDTAEMYGDGRAETLVAEALGDVRDSLFLVSKALPQNGGRARLAKACEASLRRLKTDRLDLYLLHWRGSVPLAETVEGMESLRESGKIRFWGVSNFDVEDMEELLAAGGEGCVVNQVLYNLSRRGAEFDLLPWMAEQSMVTMAYSPVEQGRLNGHKVLTEVGARMGLSPLQVALAWVLRQPNMVTIPKAGSVAHVRENSAALEVDFGAEEVAELDRAFPAPQQKRGLEIL